MTIIPFRTRILRRAADRRPKARRKNRVGSRETRKALLQLEKDTISVIYAIHTMRSAIKRNGGVDPRAVSDLLDGYWDEELIGAPAEIAAIIRWLKNFAEHYARRPNFRPKPAPVP